MLIIWKRKTAVTKHFIAAFMILLLAAFNHDSVAQNKDGESCPGSAITQMETNSNQSRDLSASTMKSSFYPNGLALVISFMPYNSALSDETMRNYALSVGLSYAFSSIISAEVRFFTGEEVLTGRHYLPVSGKLLLGGGNISIRSYLANVNRFRFYAGIGGGLQTILTEAQRGYNGDELLIFSGGEYLVSRDVSLSIGLSYKKCYYTTFVNGGMWSRLGLEFADDWLGLDVAAVVHFH
ncbi:MAG: hypothetical protein M1470_12675 [Bacteroidetes bacterium]|nr:hypothetical protein [Bacteroidota bacterium]MCL5738886.1 hypothetical protein [Bacteroidota bacterium]